MGMDKINEVMQDYVKNQEISGAALLVRRGDEILYENRWGYSRCETNQEIKEDSIYRLMSMTKCITAVAVMICIEKGLLELDAPLSRYIPEFAGMQVMEDPRYEFSMDKMKKIPLLLLMEIQSSNINIRLILVRWCMMVRCIFMPDMMNVRHRLSIIS